MISIKKIDDGLMNFLTQLSYPKRFKTPFSQFLFAVGFNLSMALLFSISDFIDGRIRWFTCAVASVFLLSIYYQWRLWRQLEAKRRAD